MGFMNHHPNFTQAYPNILLYYVHQHNTIISPAIRADVSTYPAKPIVSHSFTLTTTRPCPFQDIATMIPHSALLNIA